MSIAKVSPVATVRLRKILKAPIEKVYQAWTEPTQISKWFGCQQMTGLNVSQDFRVGGDYHIQMICGDKTMNVTGTYKEIVINKKLSYTWSSDFPECETADSLVTVQFIEDGGNTEIILDHTKFATDKAAAGHTEGWTFALDTLAKLFEGS